MLLQEMKHALSSLPRVDRYLALMREEMMPRVIQKCLAMVESGDPGGNVGWRGEKEFEFMGIRMKADESVPEDEIVLINLSQLERDSIPGCLEIQ